MHPPARYHDGRFKSFNRARHSQSTSFSRSNSANCFSDTSEDILKFRAACSLCGKSHLEIDASQPCWKIKGTYVRLSMTVRRLRTVIAKCDFHIDFVLRQFFS